MSKFTDHSRALRWQADTRRLKQSPPQRSITSQGELELFCLRHCRDKSSLLASSFVMVISLVSAVGENLEEILETPTQQPWVCHPASPMNTFP